jgi:small subunit ribosomal protein S16
MAVKIRLRRMGAHKRPFYRIVAADSRSPRDGRFIEELGYYNPLTDPADVKIDVEKAKKWISTGAKPTDTVRGLLRKAGVFDVAKPEESAEAAVQVEEAAVPEAVPVETATEFAQVEETPEAAQVEAAPDAEADENAETPADAN